MGRKRATATNGSNAQPKRGEKTAAIRELFESGVTEASAIDTKMKERGLSVSKPVIYQTIAKMKGGGGKKRGRRKGRKAATTTAVAPARRSSSGGLVLEDINQLVAITEKAGGVDVVVGRCRP